MAGGDLLDTIHMSANTAAFERTVDMIATMVADARPRPEGARPDRHDHRPRHPVVITHSLGSIVTSRALCEHPELEVPLLVTIGSPLGSPLVFDMLTPAPVDGVGAWPDTVVRWLNVASVGDKAAEVARLAERFGSPVEDRLVDNGHRAHDPEPYPNNPVTGGFVAEVLRG